VSFLHRNYKTFYYKTKKELQNKNQKKNYKRKLQNKIQNYKTRASEEKKKLQKKVLNRNYKRLQKAHLFIRTDCFLSFLIR
jgi:hypothetical protein